MVSIYIEPEDIWGYFQNNKVKLSEREEVIAENGEFGVVIYLGSNVCGDLSFEVTADDFFYCDIAESEDDCRKIAQMLYDKYLTGKFITEDEEYKPSLYIEELIEEREGELNCAVIDLLDVILDRNLDDVILDRKLSAYAGEDIDDFSDIVEDVKDHICEYLYRKHGFSIRRPMILEDDRREEFFEDYPYDCMVFE